MYAAAEEAKRNKEKGQIDNFIEFLLIGCTER